MIGRRRRNLVRPAASAQRCSKVTRRCRSHRVLRALLCVAGPLLLGCSAGVTRISNGMARIERPISSEAYARYARGRMLEASGDTKGALAEYREVLSRDPDADEALVRIGALSCSSDPTTAEESFREAAQRNSESAELYAARARCDLRRGKLETAVADAEQALRLAPEDPSLSHLVIQVHLRAGHRKDALRYAWSHVAMFPEDTRGWYLLSDVLGPQSPLYSQLRLRATERIPGGLAYSLPPTGDGEQIPERLDRRAQTELALEDALAHYEIQSVHRAARLLGLSTVDLMERALKAGAFEFARSQAQVAGALLPDDPRIWQVRLLLADLLADDAEFELLLEHPPQHAASANIDWTELVQLSERRASARVQTPTAQPRSTRR